MMMNNNKNKNLTSILIVVASALSLLLASDSSVVVHVDGRLLEPAAAEAGEDPPPGPPPIAPEILSLFPILDQGLVPFLKDFETPVTIRYTNFYDATFWNCIASYSESFKDLLTGEVPAVKVPDSMSETMFTTASRFECLVQGASTLNDLWFGGIPQFDDVTAVLFGDDVPEKTINTDVKACGESNVDITNCLNHVASTNNYSPTIMGHIVAYQTYLFGIDDGFNELGTDDGCTFNCRKFSDTTGYEPVNNFYDPRRLPALQDRWMPLLEDNGKGFFYFQEHVTPQIGQKAKFRFLPESDRTDRTARPPSYEKNSNGKRVREQEANAVLDVMSTLDDKKKIEIETFDDKLFVVVNGLVPAFIGKMVESVASGVYADNVLGDPREGVLLSLERLVHFVAGVTAAEYDSVIIAWKEKVNYDRIRPTSVIKLRGEEPVTTWAPGAGVQTYAAKDFEAYIRVMPHSEYVSGTSCLFSGLKDYIRDYLLGIGLNGTMPVSFPPFAAGTSKVEKGTVPSHDLLLEYDSVEDMAEAGGLSRFNGGMHFADAVPAGVELCSGIGTYTADGLLGLIDDVSMS